MARVVPMLPCGSLDDSLDFYTALGFEVIQRQLRPYTYAVLRRDDVDLQLYGMPDWDASASHSTFLILVEDTGALFDAWAEGLRARYGRLPVAGLPRITRPRRRVNAEGRSGFSVVDPAGNWVRVFQLSLPDPAAARSGPASTPLGRALDNAVVQADSRGDVSQAIRILDGALRRAGTEEPERVLAEAKAFAAELHQRAEGPDTP